MQTLARLFLGASLALIPSTAYPQAQQSGITPVTAGRVISATTTSSCVTMGSQGSTAIMWNTGTVGARYNINGATAILTNPYLPPGSAVTLNIPPSASVCAITASGTTTLELTQGFGWPSISFGGAVSITGSVSVTQGTSPWIVAGGGTAGTAAAGVLSVQGIASMTPLAVTGTFFQATQPVSIAAAVTVAQATAANLNATVVGTGTFAVQAALEAGSNIIGNVRIDQTTPGTTNGVQVNAALPAGTNLIGTIDGTGKTTTQVSAAPTATTFASLLASSATRKGCTIQNTGATLGYIFFGATVSATTANSFQLAAGQPISCTAGNTILTDNVAGTCASSTCAFIISSQ